MNELFIAMPFKSTACLAFASLMLLDCAKAMPLIFIISQRSLCDMKRETCGQLVIEVPLHHCKTTASCNVQCDEQKQFVCGSDNKFYRNECEMKRENCGYDYLAI